MCITSVPDCKAGLSAQYLSPLRRQFFEAPVGRLDEMPCWQAMIEPEEVQKFLLIVWLIGIRRRIMNTGSYFGEKRCECSVSTFAADAVGT